jgi:hypothetical protein
LQYIIIKQ